MMQSSTKPSDRSLFDRLVILMNSFGTLWVLLLVLIMNCDAFGRSFLDLPIAGVIEIVAISMALIVFCQLPDTIRLGKLTRSDGFIQSWLEGGTLAGRLVVAAIEVLGAIFMLLIIIGIFPLMLKAYADGVYIGTRGVFSFPDWPLKMVIVVGATVAGICFLIRAQRILSGRSPDPEQF